MPKGETKASRELLFVGQVAYQLLDWQRELLKEHGHGNDVFGLRQRWLLVNVNDFQFVAPCQTFLAELREVVHRLRRFACSASNIEA
jgi:hypothetical protein